MKNGTTYSRKDYSHFIKKQKSSEATNGLLLNTVKLIRVTAAISRNHMVLCKA